MMTESMSAVLNLSVLPSFLSCQYKLCQRELCLLNVAARYPRNFSPSLRPLVLTLWDGKVRILKSGTDLRVENSAEEDVGVCDR